jgi:hypothetical protein
MKPYPAPITSLAKSNETGKLTLLTAHYWDREVEINESEMYSRIFDPADFRLVSTLLLSLFWYAVLQYP